MNDTLTLATHRNAYNEESMLYAEELRLLLELIHFMKLFPLVVELKLAWINVDEMIKTVSKGIQATTDAMVAHFLDQTTSCLCKVQDRMGLFIDKSIFQPVLIYKIKRRIKHLI